MLIDSQFLKRLRRKIKSFLGIQRPAVQLSGKNFEIGKKLTLDAIDIMNAAGIDYSIDSGTLIGIVRDGDLLPWDDDIDFCIPDRDREKFLSLLGEFRKRGYWISRRYMRQPFEGVWTTNDLQAIKIRNRDLFFFRGRVKADFNFRYKHGSDYFWYMRGADHVSKSDEKYYNSCEEIDYENRKVKVPAHYKEFLTEKYGDWETPDKNYSVKTDDRMAIDYLSNESD